MIKREKKTWLVACDGSADSKRALDEASCLAQHSHNDEIVLLAVITGVDEVSVGETMLEHMEKRIREHEHCKELRVTKIAVAGDPREIIVQQAKALAVDYIYLGTRGQGRLKAAIMGSVASYCVHHAPAESAVCIFRDPLKKLE